LLVFYEISLTLSKWERNATDYSHAQLLFLQAVYTAQQGRFDSLAFDLIHDGMNDLREDCGLATTAVGELIEDGLLRHDTDTPRTLYTVTPEGRDLLCEPHRTGDAHGHGVDDVAESSLHTLLIELGHRYIEQQFIATEESAAAKAHRYHDAPDRTHRYDAVGLDAAGDIVITLEVERPNHDVRRPVPDNYDKLAAPGPEAAIWVTRTHVEAHTILDALNQPLNGSPRVERTYSEDSLPSQWRTDALGFTELQTTEMLLRDLDIDAMSQ